VIADEDPKGRSLVGYVYVIRVTLDNKFIEGLIFVFGIWLNLNIPLDKRAFTVGAFPVIG